MDYIDSIIDDVAGFFIGLGTALLVIWGVTAYTADTVRVAPRDSTVKIEIVGQGHGSGTHIGNGIIITASHVVEDGGEFKVITADGQVMPAEVLWFNKARDIAAVKVTDTSHMGTSHVDCRTPTVGEHLTFEGNPLSLNFQTTSGTVTGALLSTPDAERWIESLPVDGVIAPGMSGGGAFDEDGDLVGVNVAGMLMPIGLGDYSTSGFNLIVPTSTFCDLIGAE